MVYLFIVDCEERRQGEVWGREGGCWRQWEAREGWRVVGGTGWWEKVVLGGRGGFGSQYITASFDMTLNRKALWLDAVGDANGRRFSTSLTPRNSVIYAPYFRTLSNWWLHLIGSESINISDVLIVVKSVIQTPKPQRAFKLMTSRFS